VLSFRDIVLDTVPTFVTTIPSTASASYRVHFIVLAGGMPNGREQFIMYKDSSGNWIALGNQTVAKVRVQTLETSGPVYNGATTPTRVTCTGLFPNVSDQGGIGINFAVVTGPGLPPSGLLLFANQNTGPGNNDFVLAADGPSTYAGTATPAATTNINTCGFSSLYPLTDTAIGTIATATSMQYTVKLYKDLVAGTPDVATANLVATYGPTLSAVPLTSAQLNPSSVSLFASGTPMTSALVTDAMGTTVMNATISWTAPTAPDLFAQSASIWVGNSSTQAYGNIDGNVAGNATTATLAVPLVAGANYAGVTIEYMDSSFRRYWTSF
jgi:hypothetical protein